MREQMNQLRTLPLWTWLAVGALAIAIVLIFVKQLVG